jgi:hypothetical protein
MRQRDSELASQQVGESASQRVGWRFPVEGWRNFPGMARACSSGARGCDRKDLQPEPVRIYCAPLW